MNQSLKSLLVKLLFTSIFLPLSLSACVNPTDTPTVQPATPVKPTTQPVTTGTPGSPIWGHQTKTSGCAAQGVLPDPGCTPGDILPNATKDEICKPGYSSTVRNVTESEKAKVYSEYGIASHQPGQYEVDHFVSLELGGSNDISNLWPQPASPTPGFHQKDEVENYLHEQVCSGAMTLEAAQVKIATDWLSVYNSLQK